jgi:hypothetical protein
MSEILPYAKLQPARGVAALRALRRASADEGVDPAIGSRVQRQPDYSPPRSLEAL